MEIRRKPSESADDLAIVKAAAWAWYQHGSGSEGRPMRRYDLTRTHQAYKPSRYKLEAMKKAQEAMADTGISLLDSYEIERISRQLDYYIDYYGSQYYGGLFGRDPGRRRIVSSPESEASGMKKTKKSMKGKGFWLRHGVVCGSRDDVVETRGLGVAGGWPPEKHVAVIKVANCRPRASHS